MREQQTTASPPLITDAELSSASRSARVILTTTPAFVRVAIASLAGAMPTTSDLAAAAQAIARQHITRANATSAGSAAGSVFRRGLQALASAFTNPVQTTKKAAAAAAQAARHPLEAAARVAGGLEEAGRNVSAQAIAYIMEPVNTIRDALLQNPVATLLNPSFQQLVADPAIMKILLDPSSQKHLSDIIFALQFFKEMKIGPSNIQGVISALAANEGRGLLSGFKIGTAAAQCLIKLREDPQASRMLNSLTTIMYRYLEDNDLKSALAGIRPALHLVATPQGARLITDIRQSLNNHAIMAEIAAQHATISANFPSGIRGPASASLAVLCSDPQATGAFVAGAVNSFQKLCATQASVNAISNLTYSAMSFIDNKQSFRTRASAAIRAGGNLVTLLSSPAMGDVRTALSSHRNIATSALEPFIGNHVDTKTVIELLRDKKACERLAHTFETTEGSNLQMGARLCIEAVTNPRIRRVVGSALRHAIRNSLRPSTKVTPHSPTHDRHVTRGARAHSARHPGAA